MRKFGLIGYPLGHSFSKSYFENKFISESIADASYELFPIDSISQLADILANNPDLAGLNVTIPYKTEVLRYLHETEDEASMVGAVNVIKIKETASGKILKGFNSDICGIEKSIAQLTDSKIGRALILGTGGSSLSVRYVLKKLGISYTSVSRFPGKADLTYSELSKDVYLSHRLIINTTPAGMYPDTDACPLSDFSFIGSQHFIFDLIYNPSKTKLMLKGEERGAKTLNGLPMLGFQAEKSWEIWNDFAL